MRKSLFVLNRYKEERKAEKQKIRQIQYRYAIGLVRDVFYTWVDKYQYRVTRRPILLKALSFWGNKSVTKAFTSWKIYKEENKELRQKLRTFWGIKSTLCLVENCLQISGTSLNYQNVNAKQFEISLQTFDLRYKEKLFNCWKESYFKIRKQKAKVAFKYLYTSFSNWKTYAAHKRVNREKVSKNLEVRSKIKLEKVFTEMRFYLIQQKLLRRAYNK